MYNIQIFDTITNTLTQLNYKSPEVRYNADRGWFTITNPSGQAVTLSDIPVLIFDDTVLNSAVIPEFKDMWMSEIDEFYKQGTKTLLVFSANGTPLHIFAGSAISITKRENHATLFSIDSKSVCLYNLGFMVLTR